MVRKQDEKLVEDIKKVLKSHPEGTYISEIARELKKQKSTISYVINNRLKNEIIELKIGSGRLFRIIKLKTE